MFTMPRKLYLAPIALIILVFISGCGGSSDTDTSQTTTAAPPPQPSGAAIVMFSNDPKLGKILADSNGNALYVFSKDNGKSTCYGACAQVWLPYLSTGFPVGSSSALSPQLGLSQRSDGNQQVTYQGQPLYTYSEDQPGQATGNTLSSFGSVWSIIETGPVHPGSEQNQASGSPQP